MKKHITAFMCDSCGLKIEIDYGTGFPYNKGWVYLFRLEGRFPRSYKETDKHFCTVTCEIKFITKFLKEERSLHPFRKGLVKFKG